MSRLSRAQVVFLATGLVSAGLLAYGLSEEWDSVERANRLYRRGEVSGAVEIYRAQLTGDEADPALHHNLGTALLHLGFLAEADTQLRRGLGSFDPQVQSRTYQNLGYRYLVEASQTQPSESMARLLLASYEASRNTLRLSPDASDARWNLAVARQLLDSLFEGLAAGFQASTSGEGAEAEGEGGEEPGGEIAEDDAAEGEEEALGSDDPGPLREGEAANILDNVEEDPADLIRRILWVEGPKGWRRHLGVGGLR